MKSLQLLKNLLDIFWMLSIISLISIVILVPILIIDGSDGIPVKIKGVEINMNDTFSKLVVVFTLIGGLFFIYSVYLLRKVVTYFQNRDIFNEKVVLYFNLIGKLIIASSLINNIALFVYKAVKRDKVAIAIDLGGYDSFILSICLGLFFMVISIVFRIAKTMKEENELTI
jgi:hypothetical protein